MPSDPRLDLAQTAIAGARSRFLAALEPSLAQGEALLSGAQADAGFAGLGPFAAGHIDAQRFAAVFERRTTLDEASRARCTRAVAFLSDVLGRKDAVVVEVPNGGSLGEIVESALADSGRAFAAARLVRDLRAGVPPEERDDVFALPFDAWTRAERRVAPPLIVKVAGADLHVGGLERHLDGRQQIVLIVDGACTPAPLARMVTPGTFVLQTNDEFGLDRLALAAGPAIVGIVPVTAARFSHAPGAVGETWQRMHVAFTPAPPFQAVAGFSTWQMREEVRHLEALAAVGVATDAAPGTPVDTVERLTAWLLADLQSPNGGRPA